MADEPKHQTRIDPVDRHEELNAEILGPTSTFPVVAESIARIAAKHQDVASALNCNSAENASNTPDFILSDFALATIAAFDAAVNRRAAWYGRHDGPGGARTLPPELVGDPLTSQLLDLIRMMPDHQTDEILKFIYQMRAIRSGDPVEELPVPMSRVRQFVGFLSGEIPELHQVEIPRLAAALQKFLNVVGIPARQP